MDRRNQIPNVPAVLAMMPSGGTSLSNPTCVNILQCGNRTDGPTVAGE